MTWTRTPPLHKPQGLATPKFEAKTWATLENREDLPPGISKPFKVCATRPVRPALHKVICAIGLQNQMVQIMACHFFFRVLGVVDVVSHEGFLCHRWLSCTTARQQAARQRCELEL